MQLNHLHLFCRTLEPSLDFLLAALKGTLKEKRLMGGLPGAEIRFGELTVYLKAVGESWNPPDLSATVCGYNHLGFAVDDLAKTLEEVTSRPDARLVGEPFTVGGKRRCAFVAGPDNLYVEFVQDL